MDVRIDNSFMYKYLEEQHQRSAAKTAAAQAESRRKEIPYVLAKYGGIALIILSIGLALYFANSFKQISERTNITQVQEQASKSQYMGETDDLIDIDALLNEMRSEPRLPSSSLGSLSENEEIIDTEPMFPTSDTEPLVVQEIVRNYVIFDEIEFENEGISKITIGRQYDDPDSEANASWCYVDKYNSEGFKNTLYLININDERVVNEITDETADSFGVSKSLLLEAQKLCTI